MTIDQDGTITQNSIFEPFGKQIPLMDGTNSRLGFISKEKDIESSLGTFSLRNYDKEISRFTSIDPRSGKSIWDGVRIIKIKQMFFRNSL